MTIILLSEIWHPSHQIWCHWSFSQNVLYFIMVIVTYGAQWNSCFVGLVFIYKMITFDTRWRSFRMEREAVARSHIWGGVQHHPGIQAWTTGGACSFQAHWVSGFQHHLCVSWPLLSYWYCAIQKCLMALWEQIVL